MASSLSYELFVAKQGAANGLSTLDGTGKVLDTQLKLAVANGLATLDGTGKLLASQLPSAAVETYKGKYTTTAALVADYPTAFLADYAYVTETSSFWYWNEAIETPAWVNQQIAEAAYIALDNTEKAAVPYIVVA